MTDHEWQVGDKFVVPASTQYGDQGIRIKGKVFTVASFSGYEIASEADAEESAHIFIRSYCHPVPSAEEIADVTKNLQGIVQENAPEPVWEYSIWSDLGPDGDKNRNIWHWCVRCKQLKWQASSAYNEDGEGPRYSYHSALAVARKLIRAHRYRYEAGWEVDNG